MAGTELDTVRRFLDVAVEALAEAREEIDALNVYPVPDGDTGTNMYLTVAAARDAMREADSGTGGPSAGLDAFARGALLGARGNSGVILSEMLRAVARRIRDASAEERASAVLADGLQRASRASYAAVSAPVEGTMLSVLRAAADVATEVVASDSRARVRDVLAAATAAARDALAHTPEQLEVLRRAGVVDAGGRGLCVLLDAAETALTGKRPVAEPAVLGAHAIPVPSADAGELSADGPAYEVMYVVEATQAAISDLRAQLGGLGESVVVVGGEDTWHVHVHTDDAGAAIEAGLAAGRPSQIRVTHFAEHEEGARSVEQRGVVAVAAGPGLADLFREAGAVVVEGAPGRRPSTGELLEAIADCHAREIVVLPNDEDSVRTAQMAASTAELDDPTGHGVRVAVIPTRAQVQGLAALAVHEPGRTFEQDVTEMTATARHVRDGAVTVAARAAMTSAGPCQEGDALGVVAGDFVIVGDDLSEVTLGVLGRLLAPGGELVTLAAGQGGRELAERAAAWLEAEYPHVDVMVYDGGQARYPLLMSVE